MSKITPFYRVLHWYVPIVSALVLIGSPLACSAENTVYENRAYHFTITPPDGWAANEATQAGTFTVKFLSDRGALTIAVKEVQPYHRTTIGLVKEYDLTKKQLSELVKSIYGQVPGVLNPSVSITYLSNERALASSYVFQIKTLDMVGYMSVFKVEAIRFNRFYKVEAVGPLAPTNDEAQKKFARVREMLLQHIKTFVFLPG